MGHCAGEQAVAALSHLSVQPSLCNDTAFTLKLTSDSTEPGIAGQMRPVVSAGSANSVALF